MNSNNGIFLYFSVWHLFCPRKQPSSFRVLTKLWFISHSCCVFSGLAEISPACGYSGTLLNIGLHKGMCGNHMSTHLCFWQEVVHGPIHMQGGREVWSSVCPGVESRALMSMKKLPVTYAILLFQVGSSNWIFLHDFLLMLFWLDGGFFKFYSDLQFSRKASHIQFCVIPW